MPPPILSLILAQPDTDETGKVAVWAIRRLGDALRESPTPAASADLLAIVETALVEIRYTLIRAELNAADNGASADPVSKQLNSADLTAIRLITQVEAAVVGLRGYGDTYPPSAPAPASRAERRRATAASSAHVAATATPSPATATAFEVTANPGVVSRSLR
ncbi:hypothetical protein [Kitasatospora sp. NPDC088783]|uniref:hypothetical protein n=1 Tax=Kitasatospora sp. NPDC088783 TaxID=3364077 RepID=UPI0037F7E696